MKNTFLDYGYTQEQVDERIQDAFETIFHKPWQRFYFDGLNDTSYFMDTGNCDARTEGMSYGMMMCVMLDKQEYFNRLWKFSLDFMYMNEGPLAGYFEWSTGPDGKKNDKGPAPDGEEFYAMALFLAGRKWGDGEGIYNYTQWAKKILHNAIHHEMPMWNAENHLVLFVPACPFTDPSYHLMHFYHYFALWADSEDRDFWQKAETASREYLIKTCDSKTGMNPETAFFDGSSTATKFDHGHGDFYSDAYRTGANIGLDVLWHGSNEGFSKIADNLVNFFADIPIEDYKKYHLDGTPVLLKDGTPEKALHPVGLLATLAQTTLACSSAAKVSAEKIVRRFWETPLREGERRYYDNCLYMFALLALSGKYKV